MGDKITKELEAMAESNKKEIKITKKGRASKVNVNVIENEDKELEEAFAKDIAEAREKALEEFIDDEPADEQEFTIEDICEILRSLSSEDYRIVWRASRAMRKADKIIERSK